MSFRVEITPSVRRKLAGWNLPDFLLVEVYLRLREELGERPTDLMRRTQQPFDGMEYRFTLIDPGNRLCEHLCVFHVLFSQDEEALLVVNFGYERRTGV